MNILVTGGYGFIGSSFINTIIQDPSYNVINVDALTYAADLQNLQIKQHPNYKFYHSNIEDKFLLEKIFQQENIDICVNFAAQTHVDNSINSPQDFINTNIFGTFNLLECAKKFNIKKYIQISTDEVYGSLNLHDKSAFCESSPIKPNSPYSASKASADLLVRSYFKTFNLPCIITRCSNNFGPRQHKEKLIPNFIFKLLNNQNVTIYGNGQNVRDWLFVNDHVNAIKLVIEHALPGHIYNIGAHNEKTNIEITHLLLQKLGKSQKYITFVPDRPGHDLRYAIDSSKISQQLNWTPQYDFEQAIDLTIKWYKHKFLT